MDSPPRASVDDITLDELRLAARNHGMPLEGLRYDITPVGLHYLLIHYDIPAVDPSTWRLELGGRVRQALSLSLDDLHARPSVTAPVTIECAGNGRALLEPRAKSQPWLTEAVGTAEWTGAPLAPLLEEAGLLDDAVDVVFRGLDRGIEDGVDQFYERALPVAEAVAGEALLAYEVNGQTLPPQDGFPLRLVIPGWYGMAHVKWLAAVTVLDETFQGHQHAVKYRLYASEDDPGTPVTRMLPRSLVIPPGIPEFASRERLLEPGPCLLEGRAWSGFGPVERVEVSVDGGVSWGDARLADPLADAAWRGWSYAWDAGEPGRYELCSRATDAAGNVQPLEAPWNRMGFSNNAVDRIPVVVSAP
jgi:DMSO/TMAO reductase YedYZ molybdopterin-dependent catalytic subunit